MPAVDFERDLARYQLPVDDAMVVYPDGRTGPRFVHSSVSTSYRLPDSMPLLAQELKKVTGFLDNVAVGPYHLRVHAPVDNGAVQGREPSPSLDYTIIELTLFSASDHRAFARFCPELRWLHVAEVIQSNDWKILDSINNGYHFHHPQLEELQHAVAGGQDIEQAKAALWTYPAKFRRQFANLEKYARQLAGSGCGQDEVDDFCGRVAAFAQWPYIQDAPWADAANARLVLELASDVRHETAALALLNMADDAIAHGPHVYDRGIIQQLAALTARQYSAGQTSENRRSAGERAGAIMAALQDRPAHPFCAKRSAAHPLNRYARLE